ncbi:FAD-dependent oxidoreductase [Streptomyces sp. NPDC050804]|uniref:NAD(P)/FAD-dependent oxidoreductase n=1 Tax=Streptomyces sp. NPDC050804 TaxID=3154745 RepID=UPI00343A0FA8
MSVPGGVLVVGASVAGLATVEALRRFGFAGAVTVVGAESHPPYDRPPLSKQVLSGAWEPERARLRTAEALDALDAEFLLGDPAVDLDVPGRTVRTASGRTLRAGTVVVATGTAPRTLPGQTGLAGVHVLRTLDDAAALRAGLLASVSPVVVGDGVLGAEIAATARDMGLDITLVGPGQALMTPQLGQDVAALLSALHTERGVRLRPGQAVRGLTGDRGRVDGVVLENGERIPADLVVVAVGADPVTGWLQDSGLRLEHGLVCDAYCRAADGVYGAGDVARFHHQGLGTLVRLENRTNAAEQAAAVAANILGAAQPYTPVPYFWTDQFGTKIQVHGTLPAHARMTVIDGDPTTGRFVARYTHNGRTTGLLGWNMPKQTRQHRQHLNDTLTNPNPNPTSPSASAPAPASTPALS